jgi:hypothetical protein
LTGKRRRARSSPTSRSRAHEQQEERPRFKRVRRKKASCNSKPNTGDNAGGEPPLSFQDKRASRARPKEDTMLSPPFANTTSVPASSLAPYRSDCLSAAATLLMSLSPTAPAVAENAWGVVFHYYNGEKDEETIAPPGESRGEQ